MYTLTAMATLQKKTCRGHSYWQIVESRRVNGKPRPIVLMHLGTVDKLIDRLQEDPDKPVYVRSVDFGAVATLWQLATQIDLVAIIDRHAPKRHQGLTFGQYMMLAAINRCVGATSKASFYDWYSRTVLSRLLPVKKATLSSQRFWDHMQSLTQDQISAIEHDLTLQMTSRFDVSVDTLLFDATNFDTFIDTQTECQLARRGHAKSKRTDLRIVGMALLVSCDEHIPLFSHIYPGNRNDAALFSEVIDPIYQRLRALSTVPGRITLVFDGGNVSKDNLRALMAREHGFITSLSLASTKELLAVPLSKFESYDHPRLEETQGYRIRQLFWGHDLTLVVTRSQGLLRGQLRGINEGLIKKRRKLHELQVKVRRQQRKPTRGRRYDKDSLEKAAKAITSDQYFNQILKVEVTEDKHGMIDLRWKTGQTAFNRLITETLGKRVLCTNNHDWSTERIILGSRAQYHVEDAFKQMKDPHWVRFRPVFHRTDQALRVHALYCTIALMLTSLMQHRASRAGVHMSADHLYEELTAIREYTNLYRPAGAKRGRFHAEFTPSQRTPLQEKLSGIFALDELTPMRQA